ncbi:uncharacterized protein VTP21DRAFT_7748 [Calcarisporiella thermophila]|uniref:uncharacterized protein n=1 Tax=Calcarisporiella thermophila TaxID=911321 RepID=UPI0037439ACB
MASVFKQAAAAQKSKVASGNSDGKDKQRNKQRVLVLSSRGINFRQRHLLNDLEAIMPHSKKDSKLDAKSQLGVLNELAELNNCNNCIFFEVRKRQDLYLWMSKTPNGPSVKFHVQNIHTMDELKMTGNCLKGSRPLLSFDKTFDSEPHWMLLKELFSQMFGVPRGARRSKPFFDHILTFTVADNRIWFRHYQIVEKDPTEEATSKQKREGADVKLVEIGPRFVMTPIRIFEGSFGGATVFENPEFVSPNMVRAAARREKAAKYQARQVAMSERMHKKKRNAPADDPLSTKNVFQ